jgi:DNA-binding MurR/RpiR family transcriptional regulator
MLTEKNVLDKLSKSELSVYEYIKEQCQANGGTLKESMSDIGSKVDSSEATVHRAVSKLRKDGVIGIESSMEKAEPNTIIYFGVPDPMKEVGNIFGMIQELSANAKRFEAILMAKDREIEQHRRDKDLLYEQIDRLEQELRNPAPFDTARILSSQSLDDGTTAYIIRDSEE